LLSQQEGEFASRVHILPLCLNAYRFPFDFAVNTDELRRFIIHLQKYNLPFDFECRFRALRMRARGAFPGHGKNEKRRALECPSMSNDRKLL
jgi:hypothetical protein